jgi:phosphoglycolate phosphatase-like HAD superfamily hydrolase
MIKAIIFDFDGVLIESATIKTEAFREIFSRWPDKVDEIVAYHIKNMGISRFVKFRYFYENVLNESYAESIGAEMGRQFSEIVTNKVKQAPFVTGAKEFLEMNFEKYFLYIASGTPEKELLDIVFSRGIDRYFRGIFGTPAAKYDIIMRILEDSHLQRQEAIFVGDAESDQIAAMTAGLRFILRQTSENADIKSTIMIPDLTHLTEIMEDINT